MAIHTIKEARKESRRRDTELVGAVAGIIEEVRGRGEAALLDFSEKFDRTRLETVKVDTAEVKEAYSKLSGETVEQIRFAASRIRAFAQRQRECLKSLDYADTEIPGLELGHSLVPVESCGCYIPGGRYPLPSSALMSIVTARAAGVEYVAACSPPSPEEAPEWAPNWRGIHPAVLAAMDIAGADEIFCMGGAQAIAAYAYGAGPVRKVDMIAGPGNRYVTEAKRQVLGDVGIDSLAGPSEVLIIADSTAHPRFAAIDLLAQAEHDPDAKPMLVSASRELLEGVEREIEGLLETLPSRDIARRSWEANGALFLADSLEDAADLANAIAPEHLELQVDEAVEKAVAEKLKCYGSLFIGHYAPVAFGDFVSGTNHILPTMSTARFSSGLWVGTFLTCRFRQRLSKDACLSLAAPAMAFAEIEGLYAHRDSVRQRIKNFPV